MGSPCPRGLHGHGDVIQIVDTSGNVVNNYDYDVWGNFITKQETIDNPFTYFGQTYDETTGLYYLRASDITQVPGFYFHQTNDLKITFKKPLKKPWCLDGEKFEQKTREYHIKVLKDIKMLIPKKEIPKLFVQK